jgi:hypothetical protein
VTLADFLDKNIKQATTVRDRLRMRYAAHRCRIDPSFAVALEGELAEQIDWAEVAKIVLMILAAFGVL